MSKPNPDEFPPLIFRCRWRYGPGNFCSVPITPPERMCGKHKTEDRKRLAALRRTRKAEANG